MLKRIFNFFTGDSDDPGMRRLLRRLGFGRVADVVREAADNPYVQEDLLEPENKGYLKAFVMRGNTFSKGVLAKFLLRGDKVVVRYYLERAKSLDEDAIRAVLDRQDKDLVQIMLDEKLWCPFPFCCVYPVSAHHEKALNELV